MALDTTKHSDTVKVSNIRTIPVGPENGWYQVIDDASAQDNSGNSILNPAGSITAATRRKFRPNNTGTTLLIMCRYDDGHTAMTASPVIQVFGKDSVAGYWHKLKDATATHELTVTCAPTTDLTDGADLFSDVLEVDLDGSEEVLIGVKTGFNGNGTDTLSRIHVKVK